jgi:hypothetical protein
MKLSAIIVSRNDNYGGDLNTRATFCLNTMLAAFDEVVYVDWNTPEGKPPLVDDLDIKVNPERLKVIVVTPHKAKQIMGEDIYATSQPCCEVLARNIAIRRTTGDVIVSTNIDIICPVRELLDGLLPSLGPLDMITIKRSHTPKEEVVKYFEETGDYLKTRDLLLQNHPSDPMNDYCGMSDIYDVDDKILSTIHRNYHFNVINIFSGCGDFQMATRELWFKIRGFEEEKLKRNFADTEIQAKVILAGGTVRGRNQPPVYHISHSNDKSHLENKLKINFFTKNDENWGRPLETFNEPVPTQARNAQLES